MPSPIRTAQALTGVAPSTVTGPTNTEGTSEAFAHADHEHRLEVAALDDAVAIGARPTLNFTGAGVVVTDDGGNDRINIAIAGGGAASWAAVLGIGNVSGGTDPVLTNGDEFTGEDQAASPAGAMVVRGGDYTGGAGDAAGATTVRAGDSAGTGPGGDLVVRSGNGLLPSTADFGAGSILSGANAAGAVELHGGENLGTGVGGDFLVRGGDASGSAGGGANIRGGNGTVGIQGAVAIRSGQSSGGGGTTGTIRMTTSASELVGDMPSISAASARTGRIDIDTDGVGASGVESGDIRIATGSVNGAGGAGQTVGDITIETGSQPAGTVAAPAGQLIINLGNSAGFNSSPGGGVAITCGNQTGGSTSPSSNGGGFDLTCGSSSANNVTSPGGGMSVTCGTASGRVAAGGGFTFVGGDQIHATNSAGNGGGFSVTCGDAVGSTATGHGGDIDLVCGNTTGASVTNAERGGAWTGTAGDCAGDGNGGDATLNAGSNTNASNSGARGGDVLLNGGDSGGGESQGRGGDIIATAGTGSRQGKIDLITNGGSGPSGGRITRRTGGATDSGVEFISNDFGAVAVPAGSGVILFTTPDLVVADGDLVQIAFRGFAVDTGSDSNVISQFIDQTWYRTGGTLTPLTANRNDKQSNGAGWGTEGTFSLVVVGNAIRVQLNSSGAAYTVDQRFTMEFQKLN